MANTTGKKYGGRKKGTPNKLTTEIRSALKDIIYSEIDNIEDRLLLLEPKERIELVIKLIPYVLPKIEQVTYYNGEPSDWSI
jgi:hypothetical protein